MSRIAKRPFFATCIPFAMALFWATPVHAQVELFHLSAADPQSDDHFGSSISLRGTRAVIGMPTSSFVGREGSAFLFDVATGQELLELLPAEGQVDDAFGSACAIDDQRVVVGAYRDDDTAPGAGAAYVFEAGTGEELFKLRASDAAYGDGFGGRVAIDGDHIVVGALWDDGATTTGNGAYLFDAPSGAERLKLVPINGTPSDGFGWAVAVSGDQVVVGAPADSTRGLEAGAVYVFDAVSGLQTVQIFAGDAEPSARLGASVAIAGSFLLVGAPGDGAPEHPGAVYVFELASGIQLNKWTPPAGETVRFGASLSVSGTLAAVGAPFTTLDQVRQGIVHVFDVPTGAELSRLVASDAESQDELGHAVAVDGRHVLAGSPARNEPMPNTGKVYVFGITRRSFCFGDGTGASCPCANSGGPGEGCANSTGAGGLLSAEGTESVSADDLEFRALVVPAQTVLLFVGLNQVGGGLGVPFGDGLRCAGGAVVRLGIETADAGGSASWGPGLAPTGGWQPGDVRNFQGWYRDPAGPCGLGFNLTNAIEAELVP